MWREKMWRDDVTCSDVAQHLAGAAEDVTQLGRRRQRHAEHCLRCQAELVQHRKLLRALRSLREMAVEPAPGFVAEVISGRGIDNDETLSRPLLSGRRIAYAGGLAAATAAGAVSAAVLTARSRRARLVG